MRAAILAVGSELLGSDRIDTNSLKITDLLRRHGVIVGRKAVTADDTAEIATEVSGALDRHELVVVTGGLGPTSDDVTREGVAAALGRGLERRRELVADIEEKFRRFGMRMPEVNRKQADVVEGAEVIANPRGTAPGQRIDHDGRTLFLLPGVPRELEGMLAQSVAPWLAARSGGRRVETRCLRVACVPESTLEQRIEPYYREFGRGDLTILAAAADLTLVVTREGSEAARSSELEERVERLAELLGDSVYSRRREDSLERVVGDLLRTAGATVATAESCTGGLVAERLTRIAGSSDYFVGGAVAYSNRLKTELLGVPPELIERHGAVSEQVVRAMAAGARERLGSDYALAVSGVAGPGGGTADKPVGTVYVALAGPRAADGAHRLLRLPGDRERVRRLASQWILDLLRRRLAERRRTSPS